MGELKQVILIREDVKMSKGKLVTQGAHASCKCVISSNKKLISKWMEQGMKKVVLKVSNLRELKEIIEKAESKNLTSCIISDAGRTEIKKGTITCGAIGPAPTSQVDFITEDLELL